MNLPSNGGHQARQRFQEPGVQKHGCCVDVMAQSLAVREGFLEEEGQPRRQVGFKRTGPSLVGAIAPTLAYGGLYPHRVPGVRILGESLAISQALLRIAHLHVSVPTALTPYYL